MKLFTLLLFVFIFSACNQEKDRKAESPWTKIEGDCVQESSGVSSKGGCLFRLNKSLGEIEEIIYTLKFSFNSEANSIVELYSANNEDLSKGVVLRMQRDTNTVRFYIRDHEKANQEIAATDLVDNAGMTYKIKHVRKSGAAKLSLLDEAGFLIFDTTTDLTGTNNFNNFKTSGNNFGIRIKNALVTSISF
jgi:hypothetical protein